MADPFSGSQNSRAGNALQKRQEALKRWKGSETDREPPNRTRKVPKIKFSSGTVFLSAISSGDVDEVKKLLAKDADINFQNVDGLTALHQACIDENYDLVKLLVDKGARLDLRDNEGWTPLHAAASCGSVEIAQYLIDSGADIASVNNEGELPLDLAEEEEMEDLLTEEIENQGIDVVEARGEEERVMTEHAQSWLNKKKVDEVLDRSGATALHVACSKGYIKVINLLLQAGVDIDACDKEGWTPVHAAAHWGQQSALEILSEHGADLNARSNLGQTAIDLAEPDIVKLLEELKRKQRDRTSINATTPVIRTNAGGPPPLKRSTLERNSIDHVKELMQHDIEIDRSSITRIKDSKLYLGDVKQERAALEASMDVTSPKRILVKTPSFPDSPKEDKEKNDEKREESEESDSEDSEESTEESDSEEEPPNRKPTHNSVPNTRRVTANSRPQLESESDGSESETEESSEEEEETRKTTTAGSVRTTSVTRAQSTPSSVTSPTSRQASRIGNFESSKPSSFVREEKKEEPAQSRLATYPRQTIASPTSTTSTDTVRNRISSASDDNKETEKAAPARTSRAKKVTKRANTGWVSGPLAPGVQQADSAEKEVNDLDSKKSDSTGGRNVRTSREEPGSARSLAFRTGDSRSTSLDTDTSSSYSSRRNRPSSSDDKNDVEAGTGRRNHSRLADRNKDNEEPEIPAWKVRLREREKEREKAKKEKEEKEKAEKEKAEKERAEREKARKEKEEKERAEKERAEREKAEKEKENQVPSWRLSRTQEKAKEKEREKEKEKEEETSAQRARRNRKPREKRRGTGVAYMPEESDEDESAEARDAKKNTKLNEDRIRTGRTNKANAVPEITETDPKKLKEKLQDVQVELQDYKVKFEKALQEKEALQRKLSQTEDELKQVTADNQRLKDENGALIRVISKLSRTPT